MRTLKAVLSSSTTYFLTEVALSFKEGSSIRGTNSNFEMFESQFRLRNLGEPIFQDTSSTTYFLTEVALSFKEGSSIRGTNSNFEMFESQFRLRNLGEPIFQDKANHLKALSRL